MQSPRIASRSSGPGVPLVAGFCLRCSKRLHFDPSLVCDHAGGPTGKCKECTRKKKTCDPIPTNFHGRFNVLYTEAKRVNGLPQGPARIAAMNGLADAQKNYTRAVQAFVNNFHRLGGRHRPQNAVDIGVAMHTVLERIADTLDGIHDVMRFNAHLHPIVNDPDDTDQDPQSRQ